MEYEKHKIILPKFDTFDELSDYVYDDMATYHYQGGDWDRINMEGKNRPTLKQPPTVGEFMCWLKSLFPNGFRVGDKYLNKYGGKIEPL